MVIPGDYCEKGFCMVLKKKNNKIKWLYIVWKSVYNKVKETHGHIYKPPWHFLTPLNNI